MYCDVRVKVSGGEPSGTVFKCVMHAALEGANSNVDLWATHGSARILN